MKIKNKILLVVLIMIGMVGCDDYNQFEEEMYKKMVYIVTNASFNIFPLECDMNSNDSIYGLSLAVSGSTNIEQDVTAYLTKDPDKLLAYNIANFDSVSKYSPELPEDKYMIPSYSVTLKADNKRSYTLFPIIIKKEDVYKLNPDSSYFIPLKLDRVSNYSINPDKSNVLVRIYPKNKYAGTKTTTYYSLNGERIDASGVVNSVFKTNKIVTPLTSNTVRMNVGVLDSDTKKLESIRSTCMVVTVNEDMSLSIAPYAPEAGLLQVEMLDPPPGYLYNNKFEETQNPYSPKKYYQDFRLYYRYRQWDKKTNKWNEWFTIGESTSRDIYVE